MLLHSPMVAAVLLGVLASGGCEANRTSEEPADPPADQPIEASEGEAGDPDAEASASIVDPIEVREEGRNTFRVFVLEPKEGLQLERNGVIYLEAVKDEEVVFRRAHVWSIPREDEREYHVGNREHLKLISVSDDPPSVRLQIRTYDPPWWDTAF